MMADDGELDVRTPLNPITAQLAATLVSGSGGQAEIVLDDAKRSLAIKERTSGKPFIAAEGDEILVAPFIGDLDGIRGRPYAVTVRASSWVEGERELIINARAE